MDLAAIQAELRRRELGGWLFYDHHHRDAIAYRILGLPAGGLVSRRWYYLIPADGEPRKLLHRIEPGVLARLPGAARAYSRWRELDEGMRWLLAAAGERPRLAMQYSPQCALPAISLIDAGTIEQLRGLGVEIVSSGDLISRFDAIWTDAMLAGHREAGRAVDAAIQGAFAHVRACIAKALKLTEYDLQQWIVERLISAGMDAAELRAEPPIVAVNAHAGDPHYQPQAAGASAVGPGDLLLLDVFARSEGPEAAFYDVTWMGYCLRPGEEAPPRDYAEVFAVARDARDAGVRLVREAASTGRRLCGYEVDQAVRRVIEAAGYGEAFVHRTGHSLGREVHSTGANMDDFETHDEREIIPGSAFTIEPGIYFPNGAPNGRCFGVRTEVNIHFGAASAEVTGPRQQEIVRI